MDPLRRLGAIISVTIMLEKTKEIGKKRAIIIIAALVVIISAIAYVGYPSSSDSFNYQEVSYQCSDKVGGLKSIRGFTPNNQEEFKKYCRAFSSEFPSRGGCYTSEHGGTICEEYRAVLDILRRDDVRKTVDQYSPSNAWVKALGHRYIHDKDYLKRILPAYTNVKIDCIIVVHSPESTRFFIENGEKHENHKDHQYLEVPATEFLASLNNASDSDVTNFWLGLH